MLRFILPLACLALFCASTGPAPAATADLFGVAGVAVDASAGSATAARDIAIAQGRPQAWQRLYRRLTPSSEWPRQPQLDAASLQSIVSGIEVGNERRSTTRYLAEITYRFNEAAVQRILRQAGVRYVETQSRPALLIPLVEGTYDGTHAWTEAWAAPSLASGIVPIVLPMDDAADQSILLNPNLAELDWAALSALAQRHDVQRVVVANAAADGSFVLVGDVTPAGARRESIAVSVTSFPAMADAVVQRIAEDWKNSAAVDYSRRSRLTADVQFQSPADWSRVRTQLAAVRSIADMQVVAVSTREARIELSYFGGVEQLRQVMAQQYLELAPAGGNYRLRLVARATAQAQ